MGDISIKGRSPILRQGYAVGGKVKGGIKAGKKFRDANPPKARPQPPSRPKKTWKRAAEGGRIGLKKGTKPWGTGPKPGTHEYMMQELHKRKGKATGGRIGFKKGTDKNWIQKATASIKKRGTKGKCTPITKKGCTGRAKALAKTFKKMAKKRKAA